MKKLFKFMHLKYNCEYYRNKFSNEKFSQFIQKYIEVRTYIWRRDNITYCT